MTYPSAYRAKLLQSTCPGMAGFGMQKKALRSSAEVPSFTSPSG